MTVSSHSSPLFNHPQADVVIRSTDGIDFRMFKLDLSRSSSVFGDMFSLPQPASAGEPEAGLPVIPLTETREVLELVLPFCILDANPTLRTIEDACKVVEPARKYDIKRAMDAAIIAATAFAEKDPFRVYAFACLHEMDSVARAAALLCLRQPLTQLLNEGGSDAVLALLSALDYRRLLTYRAKCGRAALEAVDKWVSYLPGGATEARAWCDCNRAPRIVGSPAPLEHPGLPAGYNSPPWWDEFLTQTKVKLQGCSWEGVVSENDAMKRFFWWHSSQGRSSCSHDHAVVMMRVNRFIPIMRSRIAESIRTVTLEVREGSMPKIIRILTPRPTVLFPLLVLQTLFIVSLTAYIAFIKDGGNAAPPAGDGPPLTSSRWTFLSFLLPNFLLRG